MTRRKWIQAAAALGLLLLTGWLGIEYINLRQQAAALERDNTELQLSQLSAALKGEAERFAARGAELAAEEGVVALLQDRASHLDVIDAKPGVDGLLIIDQARNVHANIALLNGQWHDTVAGGELEKLVQGVASGSATGIPEPVFALSPQGWLAVRPIVRTQPSQAVIGWLGFSQSFSPEFIARLRDTRQISVSAHLITQVPASKLPAAARAPLAAEGADRFGVSTSAAANHAGGYAILHDPAGQAVWAIEISPPGRDWDVGSIVGVASGALLLLTLAALGTMLAVRRYVRNRRSVDGRYKALIDQANDGVVIVDADSLQVLYANPAFLTRLEYSNEEAATLKLADLFADGDAAPENLLSRLKDPSTQMALNLQQRSKSGALLDVEVRCNTLDVDGRDVLAYVTHDVSLRRKAEQQLRDNQARLDRMAHHDQLTGLPNRHYLASFLPQAIAEAKAVGNMLGVVFLDLDRFKHINDTRGHETGDKLLQEVASRLRQCVRDSDVVIRMGGDEFVVVFRSVKSYDEVTQGAARIVESLNSPIVIDQHPLQTTGSVGVSLYPRDGADMVELLKHSDTAMYQAKDRGRNNVQMFSHVMNQKLKKRVAMEAALRDALRLKQLDVHYQPFVNLGTRKVVGLEALIRWNHPSQGAIPPDQFIPVAEETGLIVPLGDFVMQRALQAMAAWRKAGASLVPMSLNVAPAQLQRGELQEKMASLLNLHAIKPSLLQLEMTERVIFDAKSPAGDTRQDTIAKLRDLGVKIAIDDFGTGYSSLSYLKNWRVDALKIDRGFVRDLVTDSSDLAIVSAIIAIAKHLQIQVIAEGIEGYQQSEILKRLGCSIGQGFLFARPMTAVQILKLLRDNCEAEAEEQADMLAAFSAGH